MLYCIADISKVTYIRI